MRLLSSRSRQMSLTGLGLSNQDFKKVLRAIKNPHGMILVTGPTGCGKTTTVYEILKILNKKEVHIASIEDPVEYDIEGVSQIQVNPKTNLTFAKGLRAIVRQDPDIIMVGEIRDEETAQIAVNSAMTGHLVLSTLHANDAATTLPRFLDMGIEPFLIASTVRVVIAQRLVRKICPKCRYSYELEQEEVAAINQIPHLKEIIEAKAKKNLRKIRLYKGAGCKVCTNSGYYERTGIFEILEMNERVREQVVNRATSHNIQKVAQELGMTTMLEDGIEKIFNGLTTLAEVLRVVQE
jgi:general secretion pathway protein E